MNQKYEKTFDRAAFWLLCAIVFDCAALGGGTVIEIFGIDIRMILYAVFFLASLPAVLRNLKGLLANAYFLLLLLWGIWTVIATVRGIAAGNGLSRILSAWIGFASFGILPGAICILKEKEQVQTLMKVISAAAFFVAVQTVILLMAYNWLELDSFIELNEYMIREELGGCTGVNEAVVRIFFRSHPLVVMGCVSSLCLILMQKNKHTQRLHCFNIALCLISLLVSYTRSVYLCVFVCAVSAVVLLCFALDRAGKKKLFASLGKSAGLMAVLLLVCDLVFGGAFLSYGIYRSVGVDMLSRVEVRLGVPAGSLGGGFDLAPETEPDDETDTKTPTQNEGDVYDPETDVNAWSDDLRQRTVQELYQRIREHPIVGSGMGAQLEVRENLDGNNEYFFLDMTYKTGLIGTALYVAPIVLMVLLLLISFRKMETDSLICCIAWLAGLLGIAAFSTLNPYLNGSNGIVLYCCTIAVVTALNQKQQLSFPKKNKKRGN